MKRKLPSIKPHQLGLMMVENHDWIIMHNGKETRASDGGTVARYVCEQNGLGERRMRVIWKRYDGYKLSSPQYIECLVWVEMQERRMPPRHEIEAW